MSAVGAGRHGDAAGHRRPQTLMAGRASSGRTRREWSGRLTLAIVAVAAPLCVWPTAEHPFHVPRLWLVAGAATVAFVLLGASRTRWPPLPAPVRWSALAWIGAVAVSSTFGQVADPLALTILLVPIAWAAALWWSHPEGRSLPIATIVAATAVASIALLQRAGADPFAWLGWGAIAGGASRMRVYATVGNPNFVGAYLAAHLPLSLALLRTAPARARVLPAVAALVQAAGLLATGSRGAWLGATTGLMLFAVAALPSWRPRLALATTLLVAGGLLLLSADRALDLTVRGRLYIWSTARPHLFERPFTGSGPGSFAHLYPRWEIARWQAGVTDDVRRFAAAQRHAHNDYLQRAVEQGIPGLLAWVALGATVAWSGCVRRAAGEAVPIGAAAGILALGATALVDFPLQRPVESLAWWTLAVLATRHRQDASTSD